jgi:ABC-2 type transport system permease protein
MKNFLYIVRWEFVTRFKSKPFLFATFILPTLLSLLIMIPILFISFQPEESIKLIGIINLSSQNIGTKLQQHLDKHYHLQNYSPEYIITKISVESSPLYQRVSREFQEITIRKDSLTDGYEKLKRLREQYYHRPDLANKKYLLDKSYQDLQDIRESKDLVEIEHKNYKAYLDSVYQKEARIVGDSLLTANFLNAYLVIPGNLFKGNYIEYHSLNTGDLLESERIQKAINTVIFEERLADADINSDQIDEWLKPVMVKKYRLRAKGSREFDFYIDFYGSLIGMVLLFMAIFTSGGFLFSSVLQEKTNRVIELLLSYASSWQIMAGKIFGLGFLGLSQVLIWLAIAALFVFFNLFNSGTIPYLNLENAVYFLHYFSLGYLFYASFFVAIGAIFSSEQDAQQANLILRTIAAIPVLLVFFTLREPNSTLITILSYIPFMTPYFMIMRISNYSLLLTNEIYITTAIMLVSIVVMVFIAAKIFRMGTLAYGNKLTLRQILRLLRSS